jgi:hypothetical protein
LERASEFPGVTSNSYFTQRLLHEVSMSYSFPCKYWLKLTPIILLTATFSSVITSIALRNYKPYDSAAKDYHRIWSKYLINARYIDLTRR